MVAMPTLSGFRPIYWNSNGWQIFSVLIHDDCDAQVFWADPGRLAPNLQTDAEDTNLVLALRRLSDETTMCIIIGRWQFRRS